VSETVKKIVIVTSGQPSANPRVVKEATALDAAGYHVTVVYAPLSPWADEFDEQLFSSTPSIQWIRAGAHPVKQPIEYKFARLRRKLYETIYKKAPALVIHKEYAFVLYAQELKKIAASLQADVFIAHNLGALPAVAAASKKWATKAGFDAEDYHRGEAAIGSGHYNLSVSIEHRYIPALTYISTASPLITATYRQHFSNKDFLTINNVFSKRYLQPVTENTGGELRLFWFSQTVGQNRGLEQVVAALNLLPALQISLHILGECSATYSKQLSAQSNSPAAINFLPATSLENIFRVAASFDIGLASEVPYCENRDICLTNKLFTYLLSSLCLLASDTAAQQDFISTYPQTGLLYKHDDANDLAAKINMLYHDRSLLMNYKRNAHAIASSTLNWEKESEKLLDKISTILAH
jgi:glycosyltransferase involved in cell wall biosynthesis